MFDGDLALAIPTTGDIEKKGFYYRGIKLRFKSLIMHVETQNMVLLKNKIYTGI